MVGGGGAFSMGEGVGWGEVGGGVGVVGGMARKGFLG